MAIQLFFEDPPAIVDWVARRIPRGGRHRDYEGAAGIGVVKDGKPVAGVIYYDHDPGVNICIAIAVEDKAWATRGIIRGLFHYPFEQLKVRRMTAMVGKKNTPSRKLVQKFGFTEEGNIRCGFDGYEHLMLYGMLREECFWLYGKRGQS